LFFVLFAATFYGHRWLTPSVSSQNSGGSLSAPTGIIASDGNYANKIGVMWNTGQKRDRLSDFSPYR
jgi:hypothetical protein